MAHAHRCRVGAARVGGAGPLLGALLVCLFSLTLGGGALAHAASTGAVGIFTDDNGEALFPSRVMAPGYPRAECLLVGTTGAVDTDTITLSADQVSGALAPRLRLTIEIGDGGGRGDCSSFTPSAQVFSGTLTALAKTQVRTGWQPSKAAQRTFRITAVVPKGTAQGAVAGGRLVWTLTGKAAAAPPMPTVQASATPTASPHATPTRPVEQTPSVALPSETITPLPAFTPAAAAPIQKPDVKVGGWADELKRILLLALQTLAKIAEEPQYPVGISVIAMGFLAVQDLFDRRDPKLAMATRTQRDNEIEFPDRFGQGTWQ